jgi:hypothetical protein
MVEAAGSWPLRGIAVKARGIFGPVLLGRATMAAFSAFRYSEEKASAVGSPSSWGINVHEDRNVTWAFVRVLVVEFVERQKSSITLDVANDRTVAMVRPHLRSADAQIPTVSALAKRLAEMHAEAFIWDGRILLLKERMASDRAAVLDTLRQFGTAATAEVPPAAAAAAKQSAPESARDSKALDDFFDGYEKEIMKARLGQNVEPDHG